MPLHFPPLYSPTTGIGPSRACPFETRAAQAKSPWKWPSSSNVSRCSKTTGYKSSSFRVLRATNPFGRVNRPWHHNHAACLIRHPRLDQRNLRRIELRPIGVETRRCNRIGIGRRGSKEKVANMSLGVLRNARLASLQEHVKPSSWRRGGVGHAKKAIVACSDHWQNNSTRVLWSTTSISDSR